MSGRRVQEPPRSFTAVRIARASHAKIHAIGTVYKPMCRMRMQTYAAASTRIAVTMPTVIEKRVSPEARMGAIDTIDQPLIGSVAMCRASGSAATDATCALSVNRYASGHASAAHTTAVAVVIQTAMR